ncbi:MAG: hypothetical protein ABG776_03790 [Cyanobacteria bacterium J06555_13]
MSESQQNPPIVERLDTVEGNVDQLRDAVNALVTNFLQPLTQQSIENQNSIAKLIESNQQHQEQLERHQDWLDEDRRDLNEARDEFRQNIQILLDDARADRKRADDKFAEMQSEIRNNQRMLLSNQEKLDRNQQQLDHNQQQIEDTLSEVLSLSRRVVVVEDSR